MSDPVTIERLMWVDYYPKREKDGRTRRASFKLKGKTSGDTAEAWASPSAVKETLEQYLERGGEGKYGATEYKVKQNVGVRVTWNSVEILGAGMNARGQKLTWLDYELGCQRVLEMAHTASNRIDREFTTADVVTVFQSMLKYACDMGLMHQLAQEPTTEAKAENTHIPF